MATVYRARDRRLGREVAVKVIHPHLRDSREVASRFSTEAKAVAKLRHPNIVDVYDVSEVDEPEQYLVVGLVRGPTLRKLLEERGRMPPEVAAAIALDLSSALAHASARGVVHRDVKPENVLIERRPETPEAAETGPSSTGPRAVVKLTDFGIAKLLDVQGVTSTGQVLGSPAHMAPEQIEGGEVDARSDVYGLGILFYECAVGHLPFEGNNPAQVLRRVLDGVYAEAQNERPAIGARWGAIIRQALAHSQADRFQDANAMREAIAAEFERLGVGSPHGDLESWLDASEAYDASHDGPLIERLCALAAEARKRGDVIAAAGDYNRALALAPQDPQLLRIVAGLHRAETRARFVRRAGAAAAMIAVLGGTGVGVARALRHHGGERTATLGEPVVLAPTGVVAGDPMPQGASSRPVTNAAPPPRASSLSTRPAPPPPLVRAAERRFTLDLKPPMGVALSIDGQPPVGVSTGDAVPLDTRAHMLSFTCPVCTSVELAVPGGDKDGTLVASVPIKPATLVVDGDVAGTYQVVEHPELGVRAGTNMVPLRSAFERVTVKRIDTGDSVTVRLEAAKTMHASFQ